MPDSRTDRNVFRVTNSVSYIVGDDDLARGDVVALADVGREALALQRDGVQTEVDQDADVVRGHDDVGVRHAASGACR